MERQYYLEDPAVQPKFFGPWRTKASRDRALSRLSPANRRLARAVRVKGKYGFTIGRKVYGPWLDEAGRNAAEKVLERRLGRQLRRFSRVVSTTPSSSGAAEALGKTT